MSLNFCKSSFFRFSNLQDKRFDVLINYLLLCLGALICVLALSIGIEAKKGKNPSWKKAIQTLLITKDVWFDAFRYKCILTYLNEIRASPQGRVCCASKVSIYPTFASRSYDIEPYCPTGSKAHSSMANVTNYPLSKYFFH
jgi:hypothetical protein